MNDPSMEARVAVLEKVVSRTESDLSSMKSDLRDMNRKLTELITAATVSKKMVGFGLTLIGVIWPIVYGILFLLR